MCLVFFDPPAIQSVMHPNKSFRFFLHTNSANHLTTKRCKVCQNALALNQHSPSNLTGPIYTLANMSVHALSFIVLFAFKD